MYKHLCAWFNLALVSFEIHLIFFLPWNNKEDILDNVLFYSDNDFVSFCNMTALWIYKKGGQHEHSLTQLILCSTVGRKVPLVQMSRQ